MLQTIFASLFFAVQEHIPSRTIFEVAISSPFLIKINQKIISLPDYLSFVCIVDHKVFI